VRIRDDFHKTTIRTLAERANQRCSNPGCQAPTSGPHTISNKSVIVGIAAHICAAAPGGKRYDSQMTAEERSDIQNGIWLCSKCAKLVDSDDRKYTPELLSKWKAGHEEAVSKELETSARTDKLFVEAVAPLGIYEQSTEQESRLEGGINSRHRIVNIPDLVRTGFRPDRVHVILNDQQESLNKQNYRFTEFLNNFVDPRWNDVPRQWRALIAGLPIIGKDIGSESLNSMAVLAGELRPYMSNDLRTMYHRRLRPTVVGILAEVQSFMDDAARAGGLHLAISAGPPTTWRDRLPWGSWGMGRSFQIDDSLLQGRWTYAFPREVIERRIDIGKTWAGFLYDIISRLPDPDRQKGQLLRKLDFVTLTYIWCKTAPQDFRPALTNMTRYPVKASDHTLAGVYKNVKEQLGKAEPERSK
jgi:hypothetical protein